MSSSVASPGPTRIAVFGSVAQAPLRIRPPRNRAPGFFSPNAAAVLERTLELVAARSTSIARPILDRAVAAGTISAAERAELIEELAGSGGHPQPGAPRSAAVARLRQEVSAAIRRAAPGLSQPLLSEAVASERLTRVQERRIIERLRQSPLHPVSFVM
jgi:hypothetical protein